MATACAAALVAASALALSAPPPDPVLKAIASRGYGRVRKITELRSEVGGSFHYRYDTEEGAVFVKRSARRVAEFEAEAVSLKALQSASLGAGLLRVPAPLAVGEMPLGGSFMLLECIESQSSPRGAILAQLGAGLAALHTAPQPPECGGFGFEADTFLSGRRQDNGWTAELGDFFARRRLEPQLAAARRVFVGDDGALLRLLTEPCLEAARDLLRPGQEEGPLPDAASLLHGDLRRANVGVDFGMTPVLYGPACWYGPAEFDLALCEIDGGKAGGGLGDEFLEAYHSERPRRPGHDERMRLFKLYHLLQQLNSMPEASKRAEGRRAYERVCGLMREVKEAR